MEDNILSGGVGESISAYIAGMKDKRPVCVNAGIANDYIEHGDREVLLDIYGLGIKEICDRILEIGENTNERQA